MYQTDNEGNLYDGNWNFIAYSWQYFVDESWNIQIFQNQQITNNNEILNQEWENNNIKTESNKSFIEKFSHKFWNIISSNTTSQKENEISSFWIKLKNQDNTDFIDKFPSELTIKEDLERFIYNIKHIDDLIFSKWKEDNIQRWKLIFISQIDIVDFLDQLSTLINSWIRLIDGVKIIKNQSRKITMKMLLDSLVKKMNNWKHLSECLDDYNYIFPSKWIKLIMAAEKSWQMDIVLKNLARDEREQMEFVSKVKWAMIYPTILIIMAIWVFILMMIKVVPTLEKAFWWSSKFPPLTQNIIKISHFMQEYYFQMVLYSFIFLWIILVLNSIFVTSQKMWDYIGLRLPIFWNISIRKNIIIFADNFSLLLWSWVLVSESLKIVAQVMPSILYRREVHKIRKWVENWMVISKMMWLTDLENSNLKENFYFPLEVAQMLKIWEETWNTIEILHKIKEVNSEKLNNVVKNLTSMLEPIITIVIWLIVGTLLLAFMVPMMTSFRAV